MVKVVSLVKTANKTSKSYWLLYCELVLVKTPTSAIYCVALCDSLYAFCILSQFRIQREVFHVVVDFGFYGSDYAFIF